MHAAAERLSLRAPPLNAAVEALRSCRGAFFGVGVFSGVINVLMLTGAFFMLQVYDRVLVSRSLPTLVVLVVLVVVLYGFQNILDFIRGRVLGRAGERVDGKLHAMAFDALVAPRVAAERTTDSMQAVRDLDQVRTFMSGAGPVAVFDLPWVPVYLFVAFLFHFWLGVTALAGVIALCIFTALTEAFVRAPSRQAARSGSSRVRLSEMARRNADAVNAMGMRGDLRRRWLEVHSRLLDDNRRTSDVSGLFGTASKFTRMLLQSLTLAVGAWLVIGQEISAGAMIACSIIAARALAPIEQAVGQWRGFVAARQSYARLKLCAAEMPAEAAAIELPEPKISLTVENLSVAPPGEQKLTLHHAAFTLQAGEAVGVIGPSASGKSTLARALVGAWPAASGKVMLDGASLGQWGGDRLGAFVGYLPQDIELFDGTIAENIARFRATPDDAGVIRAAQAAGVHELIVALPDGYQCRIGEGGMALSAGQRQRVALARALYGEPFLVVLDEPNSNLDAEGEAALTWAIHGVRDRGGVVVVVAHRPSALAAVDLVLAMGEGRQQAFGAKEEILGRVLRPVTASPKLESAK